MEPVEYSVSSHELFLIVAQTVWDFFLVSLFAVAASFLVAFIWVTFQQLTNPNYPAPRSK